MRGIATVLLIKIGVIARGFGGQVSKVGAIAVRVGDKATHLVEKIQVQDSEYRG